MKRIRLNFEDITKLNLENLTCISNENFRGVQFAEFRRRLRTIVILTLIPWDDSCNFSVCGHQIENTCQMKQHIITRTWFRLLPKRTNLEQSDPHNARRRMIMHLLMTVQLVTRWNQRRWYPSHFRHNPAALQRGESPRRALVFLSKGARARRKTETFAKGPVS